MRHASRRERLLAFTTFWASQRRQYVLRLGDYAIRHDALTDEALEEIASDVCSAFWSEKRRNRENRAIWARSAA